MHADRMMLASDKLMGAWLHLFNSEINKDKVGVLSADKTIGRTDTGIHVKKDRGGFVKRYEKNKCILK